MYKHLKIKSMRMTIGTLKSKKISFLKIFFSVQTVSCQVVIKMA